MTFRVAARVDGNQGEIVAAFRKLGFSVLIISQLKKCCDLVVSKRLTGLVEIKDGDLPPSKRKLTKDEEEFRASWKGPYFIVESLDDVMKVAKELG
jgi:hypothetical protein